MENRSHTDADLRESERLHRIFDSARADRERAQVGIDKIQIQTDMAYARRLGAVAGHNTPAGWIDRLTRECERLEAERDAAVKAADEPFTRARDGMRNFDGKFVTAWSGWLDETRKLNSFEELLGKYILETRRQLEGMLRDLRPLREIAAFFEEAREKVENWKLTGEKATTWTVSGEIPTRLQLPRLSDFMR